MDDKIIFHIDVNSAYLSWSAVERLKDDPSFDLRKIPSVIGGDRSSRHGIVLAKSIPAKAYHIETAETIASALNKCPSLFIAEPNHALYEQYSKRLMDFLYTISPDVEKLSIDECFMDFTPITEKYSSYLKAAQLIKNTIRDQFGYTVNIGISSKRALAKMASDFEKPDKIHTLFPDELQKKLWPLSVKELYMCGRSSVNSLKNLEIFTIGDLARTDPAILVSHLKSHGRLLWEYANGIDDTSVSSEQEQLKGIGNSTTLAKDAVTFEDARPVLLRLADTVAGRLREDGRHAGVITVEIKYADFTSFSHQKQFDIPVSTSRSIYEAGVELYQRLWNGNPVRLIGIRTAKLVDIQTPVQLNLFDYGWENKKQSEKQERLDSALDTIRQKYGKQAIIRGSQLSADRGKDKST
ncbi:MAG: DNA polymerase IV [Lachnospiraceae bacterium]